MTEKEKKVKKGASNIRRVLKRLKFGAVLATIVLGIDALLRYVLDKPSDPLYYLILFTTVVLIIVMGWPQRKA